MRKSLATIVIFHDLLVNSGANHGLAAIADERRLPDFRNDIGPGNIPARGYFIRIVLIYHRSRIAGGKTLEHAIPDTWKKDTHGENGDGNHGQERTPAEQTQNGAEQSPSDVTGPSTRESLAQR